MSHVARAAIPILLAAVALVGPPVASSAHDAHSGHGAHVTFSAGEPGDPKRPARVVVIVMTERDGKMLFAPDSLQVKRNEQVRFVLKNEGELEHEFMLATVGENLKHAEEMQKSPHMGHEEPNAKRVEPRASGEILWRFSKAGEFEFACLIPGHREVGMFGKVVVK